jgi:hypothetical protein
MNEQALLAQLHDIQDYLPVPWWKQPWPYMIVLAALLLITLIVWYFKRKNRVIPLTLAQQVERDIGLLVIDEYKAAEFYLQLTALIKFYLQQRFAIPIQDKTDTELLASLDAYALPEQIVGELKELFGRVTEIKFARVPVSKETMAHDKQRALALIKLTVPTESNTSRS